MLTVYHGGTTIIQSPLASVGRSNLDFGKGFYITDIYQQATSWAQRAANVGKQQWLNIYHLDIDSVKEEFRYLYFPSYDKEWLEFIVSCRKGMDLWKDYDIIEGGVADDRVIDTVNLYMLDMLPMEIAIERLAQHRPNNQLCIINQEIIDKYLIYIKSEPLNTMVESENI